MVDNVDDILGVEMESAEESDLESELIALAVALLAEELRFTFFFDFDFSRSSFPR